MSRDRAYKRVEDLEGAQRDAATAEGDVVVAAGAGSGKTTVLAARYVRLLEEGRTLSGERLRPRNVLVLTFTRKAAAEMYSRIYGALEESAALAREAAPEGELASHLAACLSSFSEAQISTFDSFAARVARSGSQRFGLAPDFAVDEDRARRLASALALSFILERREDEAMRDLVSAAGLEGARDEVLGELALRRMSLSSPPDFEAFHALQATRLDSMEAESRESIFAIRSSILEYSGVACPETSRRWLEAMAAEPGPGEAGFLAFLDSLAGLRKPGSNSRDEASVFLSEVVPGLRDAAEEHRDIAATRAAHPRRLGLYRLLDEFRLRWDAERRSNKTLGFRDVAELARDLLRSDAAIREHYRRLYRYMMIDEFQDDDELQKEVLLLLAGGDQGKLFFVGDEKQSIYLFRGADVSVFRRLAGELAVRRDAEAERGGAKQGEADGSSALSLRRNFRSEPGVIDMINAIFPSVMAPGPGREELEDYEARFEALESRSPTPGVEPRLVYLEAPRPEEGTAGMREAAEAEAWETARIVRDAVRGGTLLVADRAAGAARPARYEDFAVLLRSTGNQVHFEKYFRLLGVPYGSENACGLFSEAVACDLYYALRIALYPGDRNALAAYLRSPFAGLSDEGVVRILAGGDPEPGEGLAEKLEAGDRAGFRRGLETRGRLRSMADRSPISACLCYLWFEAGYRAALLRDPVASAFEEHFELVHSLAVEADSRGECMASFVARLELLVGLPDKLEAELPRDGSRGVRIMTVHKSKGLEFPVVIIPQANNVGQDRAARDLWYWEEALGPTFRPPAEPHARARNAFYAKARERRSAMEGAEIKRLLYVAMTRAESHIVVTATEPRASDTRGRSFRSLLGPPLGLFADPAGRPEIELPPFGHLCVLPSGALRGSIAPRSDLEYWNLASGSRRRAGSAPTAGDIPIVARSARRLSSSISSIAERYAERYAERDAQLASAGLDARGASLEGTESLEISPGLEAPKGLSPEDWGSLVHAVLELRLGGGEAEPGPPLGLEVRLASPLEAILESRAGGAAGRREALRRASRLAEVFLSSELGRRALASKERRVELKFALSLDAPDSKGGPGEGPAGPRQKPAPTRARGSIDLAFVESDRVVVVDYKTDAAIESGAHDLQVAAYKRAASEIFGLPAEAWVFYLYGGGRALLVDASGSAPRLEQAPFQPEQGVRGFCPAPGKA